MKKNNKKILIGISVAVVLIAIGIFLFYPTDEAQKLTPTADAISSSTSYFSRDSGGNFVPSAGITSETPAQSTEVAQPAQTSEYIPPTSQITPSVQPKGYLTNLKISPLPYILGNPIKVTGTFVAEAPGDYYIEAGLVEGSFKPLALTSSQSACDGKKNYAGAWYRGAKSGDKVDFELSFVDYGKTGKYNVEGGVYSRCGIGSDIASISPIEVSILSSQPAITSPPPTNTAPQPTAPGTCVPTGYFQEVWTRIYASPTAYDNGIPRVVGKFKYTGSCNNECL